MTKKEERILIVDDDPASVLFLSNALKDYELIVAYDGYQALELARKFPNPDLVLLDVMMPGLDGYEVCRMLKADFVTRDILVIFVTASNEEHQEALGFELGAVDYISKPLKKLKIQARVKIHLGHQHSRKLLQEEKQKLEKAESLALLGTWEWDITKDIWSVSENWQHIYGVNKSCLSSSELKELANPYDLHLIEKFLQNAKEQEGKYCLKHRIMRKDTKEERHTQTFGEVYFCPNTGQPIRMLGATQDISEKVFVEEALEGNKYRYRLLADYSEDVIFTMDAEHRPTYVSPSIERLLGYSQQEYMQTPFEYLFTPQSLRTIKQNIRKRQKSFLAGQIDDRAYRVEVEQYSRDGSKVWTEIVSKPIIDSESNMVGIVGNIRDISERKKNEDEMRKLWRSVQNCPAAIVVTDNEGTIEYVNPAFTWITGYSPGEAIGQNPRILKSNIHDQFFYRDLWKTISEGQIWRGEICNRNKRGNLYWENASISPVKNEHNAITNYVAVKEDISAKKELEKLKEDVERIMRHDLKTPLNSIIGYPQVLLYDERLSQDQVEIIKEIEESGKQMLEMVNFSLDMFKMETGKYEYQAEEVDLVSVLSKVVKHTGTQIQAKELEVKITANSRPLKQQEKVIIWSKQKLLYNLLSNLMVNAIEATPKKEKIKIDIKNHDRLSIAIYNKGAVPKVLREEFFEKYKTHGKSSGTGLGTYSAKLMAETMNYRLKMQTWDEENLTCVTVYIPI